MTDDITPQPFVGDDLDAPSEVPDDLIAPGLADEGVVILEATVNAVTRSGTNEFHGSAFFKWHRPGLNAFQRWNGPGNPSPVRRDTNRFNQEGGSIGGPILKNKLFGFFSYETQRNKAVGSSTTWFETNEYRQTAGPAGSMARRMLSFGGQDPLSAGVSSQTSARISSA